MGGQNKSAMFNQAIIADNIPPVAIAAMAKAIKN
jgi:hypothetical protein